MHSSSSCSLFRLASIRSSSSSSSSPPPSPRIPRLLSRWSFQPPLESTGPPSPPAFTSPTYKEKLIALDSFFSPPSFFSRPAGHTLSAELTEPCAIKRRKNDGDGGDVRSRQTELEAAGTHYSPFPLSEEMSFKSESMECYANSIVTKCEAARRWIIGGR